MQAGLAMAIQSHTSDRVKRASYYYESMASIAGNDFRGDAIVSFERQWLSTGYQPVALFEGVAACPCAGLKTWRFAYKKLHAPLTRTAERY